MRDEARVFGSRPLISVITPVFDTPVQHLEEAVESVLAQAYENWELVLVDDGSTAIELLRMLPRVAARDERIVLASLGKHGGISAASNHGLALARGEIRAKISAPPRLFFVDTPSGTAVDLGCEYTLQTDEDGTGMLQANGCRRRTPS